VRHAPHDGETRPSAPARPAPTGPTTLKCARQGSDCPPRVLKGGQGRLAYSRSGWPAPQGGGNGSSIRRRAWCCLATDLLVRHLRQPTTASVDSMLSVDCNSANEGLDAAKLVSSNLYRLRAWISVDQEPAGRALGLAVAGGPLLRAAGTSMIFLPFVLGGAGLMVVGWRPSNEGTTAKPRHHLASRPLTEP
jgi:hypothetical protein